MSYVVAGAASGILMASVFVAVVPVMLFVMARDPSPLFRAFLERVSPMPLMIGTVVLGYPVWSLTGVAIGTLYWAGTEAVPGGGLGASNLASTLAIVLVGAATAVPLFLLLRRVAIGTAILTLAFVGLFGWLLPFLATR
mgnify:CR=1 FL=1